MKVSNIGVATACSILFLFSTPAASVSATSTDDCILNWLENAYPNYLNPSEGISQTIGPYRYRYYAQQQAYIATNSSDNHVYYLGPLTGGLLFDLGQISEWVTQTGCSSSSSGTESHRYCKYPSNCSYSTITAERNLTSISGTISGISILANFTSTYSGECTPGCTDTNSGCDIYYGPNDIIHATEQCQNIDSNGCHFSLTFYEDGNVRLYASGNSFNMDCATLSTIASGLLQKVE